MRAVRRQKVIWSTGSVTGRKAFPARRAFLDWHRAHLLGLRVESCEFEGRPLDAAELFRLNFWIQALGAWRCSLLPWYQAHEILRAVISGSLSRVPVGPAGAGRWATCPPSLSESGLNIPESSKEQLRLNL